MIILKNKEGPQHLVDVEYCSIAIEWKLELLMQVIKRSGHSKISTNRLFLYHELHSNKNSD